MPLYTEEEYRELELRLLKERSKLINGWQKRYANLYDAAQMAIEKLNPKAEMCSVWFDEFQGDWALPSSGQCRNKEAMDGKCLHHLAEGSAHVKNDK